jgi:DNA-binding NarL/FixJ family response regulator
VPSPYFPSIVRSLFQIETEGAGIVTPTTRPAIIIGDSSRAMLALTEALVDSAFDVVASVMDSESLVLAAQHYQPALALLDFTPSFGDALAASLQLSQELPATKIVFFSTHDDAAYAAAAFEAGASGFLVKQRTSDLASLLTRILRGERIQHPATLPTLSRR